MLETDDGACSDGIDNDRNGWTDCDEFLCKFNPFVSVCPDEERGDRECSDGRDNDGDGAADCLDWSCSKSPWVTVCDNTEHDDATCLDGEDNDGDEHVDCDDRNCQAGPFVTVCGDPCEGGEEEVRCPLRTLIAEVYVNPPGADGPGSFIGLAGPPGTWLFDLELRFHDRGDLPGDVPARVLSLDGLQIADDGWLVFARPDNVYGEGIDVLVDAADFNVDVVNVGGFLVLQDLFLGVIDAVGWGDLPFGNVLGEGSGIPGVVDQGEGLVRVGLSDTDDNEDDFEIRRNLEPRGPSLADCPR